MGEAEDWSYWRNTSKHEYEQTWISYPSPPARIQSNALNWRTEKGKNKGGDPSMAPEETDAQRDSRKSLGYIIDLLMDSLIDWFIDIDQSSKTLYCSYRQVWEKNSGLCSSENYVLRIFVRYLHFITYRKSVIVKVSEILLIPIVWMLVNCNLLPFLPPPPHYFLRFP